MKKKETGDTKKRRRAAQGKLKAESTLRGNLCIGELRGNYLFREEDLTLVSEGKLCGRRQPGEYLVKKFETE